MLTNIYIIKYQLTQFFMIEFFVQNLLYRFNNIGMYFSYEHMPIIIF